MLQKLLSKIEPYLPAQYKEIAEHFSYVLALRAAQQLIGFVSFFFIVYHVPKEIIGHYHFVLSIIALVALTSLPGMRSALLQSVARKRGGFFKIAVQYSLLSSMVGSLLLFCIAGHYYLFAEDFFMAVAFFVAALFMPTSRGLLVWKASYSGEERFKMLSILDAGSLLFTNLMLMASTLFYTSSHIALLTIALLVPSVQNIIMCLLETKKYQDAPEAEDGMIEYGLKISGYEILPRIANEIDKLSIYNFMSPGDLAAYNVAMKIPEAIKGLFQNLGDVLMPKFSQIPKFTTKMDRATALLSLVSSVTIIGFAFIIFPFLFDFIVPPEYESSLLYTQALLCTVAVGNHAILRSKYIKSQKDADSFKKLSIMSSVVKTLTAPVLIFFMGVWGAVTAILIQRLCFVIFVEYLIHSKYMENESSNAPAPF